MKDEWSHLVEIISRSSKTPYGDALIKCMNYYNVSSLREITVEQLRNYCKEVGLINGKR